MGLFIYTVVNHKPVSSKDAENCDDVYRIDGGDFPEQLGSLKDGTFYRGERGENTYSSSYGNYADLRERLAEIAGYKPVNLPKPDYESKNFLKELIMHKSPHSLGAWDVDKGPFHELICFSDCEGFIGPEVCKKLYDDFVEYESVASKRFSDIEKQRYDLLKNVFAEGCNGFVVFG